MATIEQYKFQFHVDEGEGLTLKSAVFQALGAASVCWDHPAKAGNFRSEQCTLVGDSLMAEIDRQRPKQMEPALGLARTSELLKELESRMTTDGDRGSDALERARAVQKIRAAYAILPLETLQYRTAGDYHG